MSASEQLKRLEPPYDLTRTQWGVGGYASGNDGWRTLLGDSLTALERKLGGEA